MRSRVACKKRCK